MFKTISSAIIFIGIVFLLLPTSCNAQVKHNPGMPYYYGSFSGYYRPYRPSEPLTFEDAIKRHSYYVAYYDEQEKVISFTKYLNGKLLFNTKYFYWQSGTLEREEITDEKGETRTNNYDEKGKRIK